MVRILVPALLVLVTGTATAKELKVLTGAGMSMPVRERAAAFGAKTGDTVTVTSDTAGGVQKRVEAGEPFDLVIGTAAVLETLAHEQLVAVQAHPLAQMVAGIGVKKGSDMPDLTSARSTRAALLAARSISYVDPASGGITGVFFLGQADKLGIGDAVRAKAVLKPNGSGVADAVASGEAQFGVTLISEMLPNKDVTVRPLPDELQMTTIYTAAVATHAQNALDAAALLNDLRSQDGRDAAMRAGLKPVTP
ncbi:MAG: transporter substrate-binding protein [Alphaproteobacteria bacterium]|nr:transporter substrate-binding protein [Alphaproteobacteria bacterium]